MTKFKIFKEEIFILWELHSKILVGDTNMNNTCILCPHFFDWYSIIIRLLLCFFSGLYFPPKYYGKNIRSASGFFIAGNPFVKIPGFPFLHFRLLIQYKREGMQLHFHISRHFAHLGWETPVFFTLFTLSLFRCRYHIWRFRRECLPIVTTRSFSLPCK
jgi:hypothetical protein